MTLCSVVSCFKSAVTEALDQNYVSTAVHCTGNEITASQPITDYDYALQDIGLYVKIYFKDRRILWF